MALFDDIQRAYIDARKKQDKFLSGVLGMLVSDIKYEKIEKQRELLDDDIISLIKKNIKQKREAIEEFKKGNREDLVENATKEIEVLSSFLPPSLSEDKLEEIVKNVISELNATSSDFGRVMKEVMQRVKGQAEGSKVKEVVSKILQG